MANSLLRDVKKLFGLNKKEVKFEKREQPNPKYAGSVIVLAGQPGSGKTYRGFQLACIASFHYKLPLIAQDIRGDVRIYRDRMIQTLEHCKDKVSKAKLEFLSNPNKCKCLTGAKNDTAQLMAIMENYKEKNRKAKNRKAECFLFIDEGGVLRRDDEDFWDIAAGFRNSGITAYTTIHKDTDISRVGRQAIRAVILQRGYEGEVDFFGKEIPAEQLAPPMSNTVTYIDSFDRQTDPLKSFEFNEEDPLSVLIPDHEVLIHPVQPTYVERMVF